MVPEWTISGALPPYVGDSPLAPADMSPYTTTVIEVGRRFATSPIRRTIFKGFLEYRRALATVGAVTGFQWLNGSFLEDVERVEGRSPRDMDVVTFSRVPIAAHDTIAKRALMTAHPTVFLPDRVKDSFFCHAFFVDLDAAPHRIVENTRYWFGLFSHRRATNLWKGMVAVPIGSDDAEAWRLATS